MKKNLLLLAALAATMGASAQSNYCFMDMGALGYDGSADIPEGTILCQDDNGTLSLFITEPLKTFTPSKAPYEYVAVAGGEAQKIVAGTTGNNNPKGQSMSNLPTSGLVYKFTTTKSGFLTVLTKMNSNKNYWVFRGTQSFAPYRLGMVLDNGSTIEYVIPHNEYDELDEASADFAKYFGEGNGPVVPYIAAGLEANAGEGSGFISLPVIADPTMPDEIYFWAQGSKMACDGFIFTPTAEGEEFSSLEKCPQVVFSGVEKVNGETGEVTPAPTPVTFEGYTVAGGSSAIEDIIVDGENENAPMFNVLGQQVDASYKGLVIKNGKKFINR